jgi:glutamine amidotransferase-like uncharacterized protein
MKAPSMKIALFVHQPKCSIESGNGILQALQPYHTFKIFTKWRLDADFFDDVDCIAFPGGIGDRESWHHLTQHHTDRIKQFVRNGGKYLGICMGAYWADKHFFDLLVDIQADQYITRPNADTRRPHAKAQKVLWKGQEEKMFFYDGCAFHGSGLDTADIYAVYPNGDPMAIIQGRIGLIGCHPESTPSWYSEYYNWMKPHYHDGKHHELLLDFVNDLSKR